MLRVQSVSLRKMQKIITIKYINKNCARYHLDKSLQLSRKFMSRDISERQDAVTKHFFFAFKIRLRIVPDH